MDIERDLQKMIDTNIEHWKEVKHQAVFSAQGGDDNVIVGELYVDGNAVRKGLSGNSAWVTLEEAKRVANALDIVLQIV